ncbi:MAG: hypothetical protein HY835_00615 [Anaerolineae bacterium]|nr:hypothetical protein [Anaerolineae bacterium]
MKLLMKRAFGILLILTALIGLAISITGLSLIGRFAGDVTTGISASFDILERTLSATSGGLEAALTSLEEAQASLGSVQTSLDALGTALSDSQPALEAMTQLLSEDLPQSIASTQQALDSAAATAQTVDNFLTGLSQIPFIGSAVYQPEVPLQTAILDVGSSLDALPPAMEDAGASISKSMTSLDEMQGGMDNFSQQIGDIQSATGEGSGALKQYLLIIDDIQGQLDTAQQIAANWVRVMRLGVTALLIWMALAQLGLFSQGLERLQPVSRPSSADIEEKAM